MSAGRWIDLTYARAGPVRRATRRLAGSGPGARAFAPLAHRLDRPVHRLTRGRATLSGLLSGLPVALLTTTGARTGRPRAVPLLLLPSSEGLVVIASNWGRGRPAAWERNLRADPKATLSVAGTRLPVRAVEARGEGRTRIWSEALEVYPGFAAYARRAGARPIGVYVLEEDSPSPS